MTTHRSPISAYLICRDEVDVIGPCIESLSICNEIVIVDSGSTDGTLELVENYRSKGLPIRLFRREWPGFAAQKQFALDQCEGPWCLNLDCDERLDAALQAELAEFSQPGPDVAGYAIREVNYLPGYGYPPATVHAKYYLRLVRKHGASYDQNLMVHESLTIDGNADKLHRGRILHFRNISIGAEFRKADSYSGLKALDGHRRGKKTSFLKLLLKPLFQFFKLYLAQRYFLCRTPGFIYAVIQSSYVFMTEAKLYRLAGNDAPRE